MVKDSSEIQKFVPLFMTYSEECQDLWGGHRQTLLSS